MRLFTQIAVLFYVTLVLFFGCFMLLYVLNWLKFEYVHDFIYALYTDDNLKMVVGISSSMMLLINYFFYRIFSINAIRERVIAFQNPAGKVRISLLAVEDLIKKAIERLPEVKESRLSIKAKKGLQIKARLTIYSDVNIPDLTSHIQDMVRKKIIDIVGLEESINVEIFVVKILSAPVRDRNKGQDEDEPLPHIPFQGYRA